MTLSTPPSMALVSGPQNVSQEGNYQPPGGNAAIYPLTLSQEGIWVDYQANRNSTQYNLTLEWNLVDKAGSYVDIHHIVAAISELTKSHAVLRSTILVLNGKPHVREHSPTTAVPVIRLLIASDETTTTQPHPALCEGFDLESELSVRWYIIQHKSGKQIYLVSHHIALDGGGLTQLSTELFDVLDGKTRSQTHASKTFSQAHLVEQAWSSTEASKNAEMTCVHQLLDTHPFRWSNAPQQGSCNFRHLQTWMTIPKDELQVFSSRFSTSWFRVSVSLVGLLLHIDTGATLDSNHALSVSFGGRAEGFENTVGHFANPLPVKIPTHEHFLAEPSSMKNTLASLITSISRNMSQVKKAERLSMLDLSRRWRTKGGLGQFHSPQVAVSFAPALPDRRCRLFPVEGRWDLFFVFQDGPDSVELGVIYDPTIFNKEAMRRMRSTYEALLELCSHVGPVTLNELPTMPKHLSIPLAQKHKKFIAVHDMFRLHAINNPDRIALSCAEQKQNLTYGQLDVSSTLRAQVLQSHGVEPESVVILHLQRGFHLLEWILATLKAGGAYVYLDPKLPDDRKKLVLSIASGPKGILVTDDVLVRDAEWAKHFTGIIVPHAQTIEPGPRHSDVFAKEVHPGNLAYMIFTSGSTGEPKGVMIEHGSFAHFVRSSVPIYRTGHGSRVLQLASFNFDASILEWSSALATGGTLCFADSPQALVGEYLADVIEQNAITFMQITPSALATIPLGRHMSSLRCVSVGGEAVPANLVNTWRERCVVINSYGPTETSVAVTFQNYTKGSVPIEQVSAGKSPEGTEIYICDPDFTRILADDTEGEICIEGESLGRGYCQRSALTEAKFAIHPILGRRLYRSGDRGILLPDGSLVVNGRMDREIKIRGYRIAPEEVEKAIMTADNAVYGASVHASSDGLSLIAIITPGTCQAEKVRHGISKILPSHMHPSEIVAVPSLPLNASGKIDHNIIRDSLSSYIREKKNTNHLRPLKSTNIPRDTANLAERDVEVEKSISKFWQEMIGISEFPNTDINFFDMGGHSHLVPRLHKMIASMYPSCNVTTLDLFYHSTIRSQTRLVCKRLPSTNGPARAEEDLGATSYEAAKKGASADSSEDEHSIAIIGIAGKFPGAENPDDLLENLTQGVMGIRDSTTKVCAPKDCVWVPRAGTLSGIEEFDAKFWKLTREEAADMDPQQRLFLNVTLQALEDAGLDTFSDTSNNIGVFVGAAANQYHTITDPVYGDPFQRANRGFVAPCISARTAYHLNLHGPNVTINTNCASSTVALSLAVDALRSHRCDVAVVGGVSVQLFDGGYVTQPKNIFSLTGCCKPFEEEADGTVPSDAVVAVVLKRTADAVLDGDGAYALVVGAAYNSDGATDKVGYQVPSPNGQSDAIAAAWKNSRMSPDQLQYIELHGSGTQIGDALELEAIRKSLQKIGYPHKECLVGSNKGTLGNTQHASGLTSLVKICKSIQTGTIPAMVRTGKLNSFITDANLCLHFAYQPTKVQPNALIGISAAGWGGVNSHVVVQVPPAEFIKKMNNTQPRYTLCNKTLAAPRKLDRLDLNVAGAAIVQVKENLTNGHSHSDAVSSKPRSNTSISLSNDNDSALHLLIREVTKILDQEDYVDADTDLHAAGFDSARFVRLSHAIRKLSKNYHLPVSSFIQSSLTPATLADKLEKSKSLSSDPATQDAERCPPVWVQLQDGTQSYSREFILLPPSGGTCVALAGLVSAIPDHIPVYGLEHPTHSTSLEQHDLYSVPRLAKLYADALSNHLDTTKAKKTVIIGVSFGGVIATEMLLAFTSSQHIIKNLELVLLDSPIPGLPVQSLGGIPAVNGNGQHSAETSDNAPIEAVHRANIDALRMYNGPVMPAPIDIVVLFVSARAERPDQADLGEKKQWWTRIFPSLRWEQFQSSHEELWQAKAADVLSLVQE